MWKRMGTAAAAGLVALLLGGQQARADDDTMRLGGNIESKTTTLSFDGISDTTLTRGVRGFVGNRGHFGGGGIRVGFRVGFYGGGSYGGYYGGYYPAYYPSYYYPSYYYQPYRYPLSYTAPILYYPTGPTAYYSGPSFSNYPISNNPQVGQPATVTRPTYATQPQTLNQPQVLNQPQRREPIAAPKIPMQPADGGTYPYDGGPVNPVPLPMNPAAPSYNQPGTPISADGRYVSLPAQQQKLATTAGSSFAYPAYGDNLQSTTFATNGSATITVTTKKK